MSTDKQPYSISEAVAFGAGYLLTPAKATDRSSSVVGSDVAVPIYPYDIVEQVYTPVEGNEPTASIMHCVTLPAALHNKTLSIFARVILHNRHVNGAVFASAGYENDDPAATQYVIDVTISEVDQYGNTFDLVIGDRLSMEVLFVDATGAVVGASKSASLQVIGR